MYKTIGNVTIAFHSNLYYEDVQEALREGYKQCFGLHLFPSVFIKNNYGIFGVRIAWLLWQVNLTWFKWFTYDYDIQGNRHTIRKGFRYYLTFGKYTK